MVPQPVTTRWHVWSGKHAIILVLDDQKMSHCRGPGTRCTQEALRRDVHKCVYLLSWYERTCKPSPVFLRGYPLPVLRPALTLSAQTRCCPLSVH